jgi:hypothetical protein
MEWLTLASAFNIVASMLVGWGVGCAIRNNYRLRNIEQRLSGMRE